MASKDKCTKTRDGISKNNINTSVESNNQIATLNRREDGFLAPSMGEARDVENDQFSISAHSSDSANAINEKGDFSAIFGSEFKFGLEENDNHSHNEKCEDDDEYSINAEESKSEHNQSQPDEPNGNTFHAILILMICLRKFRFIFELNKYCNF